MKLLVFGKTGQVGHALSQNSSVISLDREDADFTDPAACAAIVAKTDADAIINAAAYTQVDNAEDEEPLATVINGDTPTAIAKAASSRGLPFVHISTDYVFDGRKQTAWAPQDETAPINAYGRSKLAGEVGIQNAGGAYGILRTSWVFSAHGANFVKTMLRLSQDRTELNIVADQVGGPTSATDIANTCIAMAQSLHTETGASGVYHYAGFPNVSWADFAAEIFDQAGRTVNITKMPSAAYPTSAARPQNSIMDCSELQKVFSIEQPDWRKSLKTVLQELKVDDDEKA